MGRLEALKQARRIVVKVGSAVLTGENGLDLRVVNRLADQLAVLHDKGREIVLVSSGAVAAGCKVISNCQLKMDLASKQATSAVGQSRLMHAYDEAFARYGKVTAQILLTKADMRSRSRFLNARNTFGRLMQWKAIPVVNENDTVAVQELKFGDNDAMASLVINLVEADLFINLTSADGVFDGNPLETPNAKLIKCIDNIFSLDIDRLCQGKTIVGSGGMQSKLLAAKRAAQLGVPTLILSGKTPFGLEKVFGGEDIGTWVEAGEKSISRKKFWMAYNLESSGELLVDRGAEEALSKKGKSLLAAGIAEVRGNFGPGALVSILGLNGEHLGVGLSNYSNSDLKRIQGHGSEEIEAIIGNNLYTEVVHRDNLLLGAAL